MRKGWGKGCVCGHWSIWAVVVMSKNKRYKKIGWTDRWTVKSECRDAYHVTKNDLKSMSKFNYCPCGNQWCNQHI